MEVIDSKSFAHMENRPVTVQFKEVAVLASLNLGSLGFRVKGTGFRGASGRTPARTPKSGYLPLKFPKSLNLHVGQKVFSTPTIYVQPSPMAETRI